jgi:hypothetical protein
MAHDSHAAHGKVEAGRLTERRFTPEPTERSHFQALVGGLGAAALGAGAYATWLPDTPMSIAPFLFGGGTVGLIAASVMGSSDAAPLLVGDAGVAKESGGGQPDRIAWYQVEKVTLEEGKRIVVEGAGKRLVAPVAHHGAAAGAILREALQRIPKRVSIAEKESAQLLRDSSEHGTLVAIEPVQVTGRRCKASNTVISFERDARICPRCGEVYDRKHVPTVCLTCEGAMPAAS